MKILKILLLSSMFVTCSWSALFDGERKTETSALAPLRNAAAIAGRLRDAGERGDKTILVIGAHGPNGRFAWEGQPSVTDFYLDVSDKAGENKEIGKFLHASANDPEQLNVWIPLLQGSLDVVMFDERVVKWLHPTPDLFRQYMALLKPGGELHIDVDFDFLINNDPTASQIDYKETQEGVDVGVLNDGFHKIDRNDMIKKVQKFYQENPHFLSKMPELMPYGQFGRKLRDDLNLLEHAEEYEKDLFARNRDIYLNEATKQFGDNWKAALAEKRDLRKRLDQAFEDVIYRDVRNVYKDHVAQWLINGGVLAGGGFELEMLDTNPLRKKSGVCARIKRIA